MISPILKKDLISCADWCKNEKVGNAQNFKVHDKISILLFGIDLTYRSVIENELYHDYHLIFTQDIIQALDHLFVLDIQLVMIDINWSNVESSLFSKFVKSHPDYSHIPVLCFVESSEIELKVCGLTCGADILFDLPAHKDYLKVQVNSVINNRNKVIEHVLHSATPHEFENQSKDQMLFMDKLYAIIERLLLDENLSVNALAEKMNMSRSTLYRKIQDHSNQSLNALIKEFKFKKATNLLIQNKFSIAQVSYMLGYSVQSNFSRDFLKIVGVRPSAFRMKLDE